MIIWWQLYISSVILCFIMSINTIRYTHKIYKSHGVKPVYNIDILINFWTIFIPIWNIVVEAYALHARTASDMAKKFAEIAIIIEVYHYGLHKVIDEGKLQSLRSNYPDWKIQKMLEF